MRILKLRFQNLNSLAGKWEIDFTVPEYSSGAIFAIVGPTGSGKTTILDAISLALYGKTPRLNTISENSNEIMTRHTKECCAEVEFETSKGKFTCRWSQTYKKRHSNTLDTTKHRFFDETGEIYATLKKDVKTKISEATGLNFKQFTQSVLLAQGQFATFLNADPKKERSLILGQITGTDYSEISKEINKRKSTEEGKLEGLQSKAEGIAVLSPADEEELIRQKNEADIQSKDCITKIQDLEAKINWRKQSDELQNQIDAINEEKRMFDIEKENSLKDIELLNIAKKANTIEPEFIYLTTKRQQNDEDLAALKTCQVQKTTFQQNYDTADNNVGEFTKKLDSLKGNWELEKPKIKEVRSLDQSIGVEKNRVEELKSERQGRVEKCQQEKKNLDTCNENLETTKTNLQKSIDYLSKHRIDDTLGESLSALDPRFETYWSLDEAINKKTTDLRNVIQNLDSSQNLAESQKHDLDEKLTLQSNKGKAIKTLDDEIQKLLKKQKISFWRKKEATLVKDIEKLNNLKRSVETSKNADIKIKELKKESDTFTKKYHNHKKTLEKLVADKEKLSGFINDLEEQVRQQNQVKDLDNERKSLEDNKPCPLCGSLHHPYAKGNIPEPDKTIQKLDQFKQKRDNISEKIIAETEKKVRAESDIRQNKEDQKDCHEELKNIDRVWAGGCKDFGFNIKTIDKILVISHLCKKKNNEQNECHGTIETVDEKGQTLDQMRIDLNGLEYEIFKLNNDYQISVGTFKSQTAEKTRLETEVHDDAAKLGGQRNIINEIFKGYGYQETDPEQWSNIRIELSERNDEYRRQNELKQGLESEKNQLQNKIQSYDKNIEEFQLELHAKNDQLASQKEKVDKIISQRNTLYGDKNPDSEEERLSREIREATNTLEEIREGKHGFEKQLNEILVKIQGLEEKISADNSVLQNLERKFISSLQIAGFADEIAFSDARLPLDIFNLYQECETRLKNEEIRLQGIIHNRTEALNQERQKNLTDLTLEKLSEDFGFFNDQLRVLNQKIGEITGQLNNNADAKTKYDDLQVKREKQRTETNRWKKLDEYIGSSTGIKFQIIAQKLTFKQLIAHANHHLRAMSGDRYLLIPKDTVDLDMDIRDDYQAGVKRSTKNLSGGESFIVSLALALGLSSMSSKKVQIDSFFLDEGFGTLDDESLDTALVTLSELERKGKLIGIISHVPAIKERISTQIVVEKKSRGRSWLKGPGVKPPKQVRSP